MRVTQLRLTQFRSYKKFIVDFASAQTLFYGPNGAGKTNLIEAVYILGTLQSFRTRKKKALVSTDNDFYRIEGEISP